MPPSRAFNPANTQRPRGEAGYILIGVLILVALFFIALAVAAPIMAKEIERDKEVEAVQRGKQYTRAIKLYYKRFGNYPANLAALENTNNIRYLRKRYIDPITGKDDWRLIHVGQAKVPVMGFFGQPLAPTQGSATTGLLGNGTGGVPGSTSGTSPFGTSISTSGGASGASSSDPGSSGTATAGGGSGSPAGVIPGASSGSGSGQAGTTTGTNGTNQTGIGNTFEGGGPIVGVGITVDKKSLIVYHKQDKFNKWEFTYDPLQDQMVISSSTIPGTNTPGSTTGGSGTGSQSGSNPFGNNNGSGSSSGGTSSGGSSSSSSPFGSSPTSNQPQN